MFVDQFYKQFYKKRTSHEISKQTMLHTKS